MRNEATLAQSLSETEMCVQLGILTSDGVFCSCEFVLADFELGLSAREFDFCLAEA